MDKISIILIIGAIVLLTSTSLTFANPQNKAVSESRKEYIKTEHEGMKHERELKKEERKRKEKAANKRRKYMALMYVWISNKR